MSPARRTTGQGVAGPPCERVDAGDQLVEAERLGEVVVGAEREAGDDVARLGRCGEHEDLRPGVLAVQDAAHVVAVDLGEVAIEDDDVVGVHACVREGVGAVGRDVDGRAVPAQAAGDRRRDARLVLDDEKPHAGQRTGLP
jgi:hypothetical protein